MISQAEREYYSGALLQPALELSPEQDAARAAAETAAKRIQTFNARRAQLLAAAKARHPGKLVVEAIDYKLRTIFHVAIPRETQQSRVPPRFDGFLHAIVLGFCDANPILHLRAEPRELAIDGAGTYALPADIVEFHIVGTQA